MHVVCEAMQSDSSELTVSAYECLVRIMQLYYGVMPAYMDEALLPVSMNIVQNACIYIYIELTLLWLLHFS
jgi:importin subunit beta-1